MKKSHIVLSVLMFAVSSILPAITSADTRYKLVATGKQPYVEICRSVDDCKKINLPILDEPTSYSLRELQGVNGKIVIAEPTQGGMGVNYCSDIYLLTPDGVINELITGNEESICNVSIHEDTIISNYRDAGKWYDVVYRFIPSSKNLIKELEDECVGCGAIARTEYNPNNTIRNTWLVTDTRNYWERKPITGRILKDREWLYNTPNVRDKTKMYLVKGDVVILKKEQFSEDETEWFYFIEFQSKNNHKITKWIKVDAIEQVFN
jgi:hypothetical protein